MRSLLTLGHHRRKEKSKQGANNARGARHGDSKWRLQKVFTETIEHVKREPYLEHVFFDVVFSRDDGNSPHNNLEKKELVETLLKIINEKLTSRERNIFISLLFGYTLEETAKKECVSRERIRQINNRAEIKILFNARFRYKTKDYIEKIQQTIEHPIRYYYNERGWKIFVFRNQVIYLSPENQKGD